MTSKTAAAGPPRTAKKGGGCPRWITFLVIVAPVIFGVAYFVALQRQPQFLHQHWPQAPVDTSAGTVDLPILYYDGGLVGAFYFVDPAAAQELLPEGLAPLTLPLLGKAVAGVFMFQYRNTTIGPYGEMGLTVYAMRPSAWWFGVSWLGFAWDLVAHLFHFSALSAVYDHQSTGLHVVTLPVTTKSAMAAGREIWGYPKYVEDMKSDFSAADKMSFSLSGEFDFAMSETGSLETLGLPFLTYSLLKGQVVKTAVEVGHSCRWGGATTLKITGSKGPTATRLRSLHLDSIQPVAVFRTDTLQAVLPLGKEV